MFYAILYRKQKILYHKPQKNLWFPRSPQHRPIKLVQVQVSDAVRALCVEVNTGICLRFTTKRSIVYCIDIDQLFASYICASVVPADRGHTRYHTPTLSVCLSFCLWNFILLIVISLSSCWSFMNFSSILLWCFW